MGNESKETSLTLGEDFLRSLLDHLAEGVYVVDRQRRICLWSRGAERITGFPATEVAGQECAGGVFCHLDEDGYPLCPASTCLVAEAMRTGQVVERRVFLFHRDGYRLPVRTRVVPLRDRAGQVVGAYQVFAVDEAAQATAEQLRRLQEASLLDPVTGVGNSRFAGLELANQLAKLQRYGWPFGVILVGVDGFSALRQCHGEDTADAVLSMVARTLSGAVRSFDAVCRWRGEEFVLVLANVAAAALTTRAEQIRRLVERSALVRPAVVGVTSSLGATLAREDDTPDSLMARAEALLLAARQGGGNRVAAEPTAAASP